MGWRVKKGAWYSPRAIKEPTSRVEEVQTGPNSFRYVAKKPSRLETKIQNPGLTYEEYRKQKKAPKRNQWADDAYDVWEGEQLIHYNKPTYAFEATRWSNWSYSSFLNYGDSDDNSNLMVKEPENYLTPTNAQINAKCNYWTGKDIRLVKELARVCYFKMIGDGEYLAEDFTTEDCGRLDPEKWREKKAIFDNVYETYIPGFTPLEQAVNFQHKLKDAESHRLRRHAGDKHKSKKIEFRRSDYADPVLNGQLDQNKLNRQNKMEILNKISIIGDLGTQFKVEKGIGEVEAANSDIFRKRMMRGYDQIRLIEMYQRMLPTYKMKFLTKDLIVNVPVQLSEKKQKIIILLDQSGSMNDHTKQAWVNALLVDRFRYVIKGEAEVFFSYFTSSINALKFHHVKNQKDVDNFWSWFSNSPGGSLTNIGKIVTYVAEEIKAKRLHNLQVDLSTELPEILIVNDGQDQVGYDELPYKVNAISLIDFSDELRSLCIATGGKQVKITESDRVVAYSSNGMEIIAD